MNIKSLREGVHYEYTDWISNWENPESPYHDYYTENNKIVNANWKLSDDYTWHSRKIASYDSEDPKKRNPCKFLITRSHTVTDIGRSLIVLGGISKQRKEVQVLVLPKTLTDVYEIKNMTGSVPCCRWAHSASYIAPLDAILFCGGFDSTYNYNDLRLFYLSGKLKHHWLRLDTVEMDLRAFHSSVSRYTTYYDIKKTRKGNTIVNKEGHATLFKRKCCEIYIFGGQFCNGGPYVYNNEVVKVTFWDKLESILMDIKTNTIVGSKKKVPLKKLNFAPKHVGSIQKMSSSYFDFQTLDCYGDLPDPRSQQFSFISNDSKYLYIYGGLDAKRTMNDLYRLNLTTLIWEEQVYNQLSVVKPPNVRPLIARNFRINMLESTKYYSSSLNKILVAESVDKPSLSELLIDLDAMKQNIQNNKFLQRNKYEKDLAIKNLIENYNKTKLELNKSKKLQVQKKVYILYVLDLETLSWNIIDDGQDKISEQIVQSSVLKRVGSILFWIGGIPKNGRIDTLNNLFGLKIPTNAIAWGMEKELWVGNLKNLNNEKCYLRKLPKDVIGHILSFHKESVW